MYPYENNEDNFQEIFLLELFANHKILYSKFYSCPLKLITVICNLYLFLIYPYSTAYSIYQHVFLHGYGQLRTSWRSRSPWSQRPPLTQNHPLVLWEQVGSLMAGNILRHEVSYSSTFVNCIKDCLESGSQITFSNSWRYHFESDDGDTL
jgi:hypothetical protein